MNIARTNGSEHTRQQILAAALRLFATHAIAGTSTQAIIAASRVSKPVLYYTMAARPACLVQLSAKQKIKC